MKHGEYLANFLRKILICCLLLFMGPTLASSEETYVFERMWPTLQQPWYFTYPEGIAVDSAGNVYVADTMNHRIQKFTSDGQFVANWGKGGSGDGEFHNLSGVEVDNFGYVYVADRGNNRIQKFTSNGQFITKWGTPGTGDGQFDFHWQIRIAFDSSRNVYVTDDGNHRIQKFDSDGQFLEKWGSEGSGDGEFYFPCGIAIDNDGYIYVSDNYNRIQKFDEDGQFVAKWGGSGGGNNGSGSGDGEFNRPYDIAIGNSGFVYVVEQDNHRIQKFTSTGVFVDKWGTQGREDGQFWHPTGLAIDTNKNIYVVDTFNNRIQKLTSEGHFLSKWASSGVNGGDFDRPSGITVDSSGNVYVSEAFGNRIQKFTSEGQFVKQWGSEGSGDGQFKWPYGMAIDSAGFLYVADSSNDRIQKFTLDGQFVKQWGSAGSGDGQFNFPIDVAVDSDDFVYVVEFFGYRVQKFTTDGQFVDKWGSNGSGDGQFNGPAGIAADDDGFLYVVDANNRRIQKFTSEGVFQAKWGSQGSGDGQFNDPRSIAVDSDSYVYVGDVDNDRIQKFTSDGQFVAKWGENGNYPDQMRSPWLAVGPNGYVFVAESSNNRIQVFKKVTLQDNSKAIIVAGGGPYPGNNIWDATQMCANFAYRTLTYQGFTKETIHYLTSDTELDLDSNGALDDVDGDATNLNLEAAISGVSNADSVILYFVDHGGNSTFRMSGTETLSASDLDSWLDTLQSSVTGMVTVIYDACESGSFISELSGTSRMVITSTSPDESAYFVQQGSVSFSNYFWTHIFNGLDIKEAFSLAKDAIGYTTEYQHPLLDANGNGTGNETEDYSLAENTYIGNGTVIYGDIPLIGSISGDQTISGTTTALIYASGVTDTDGIARVWSVVRPPDYSQGSSANPVQGLPTFDLMPVGGDQYEATYDGFNIAGTYQIAVYARDRIGNTSIPLLTTVNLDNPLRRRAIIVTGSDQSDDLWSAIEKNATHVYEALTFQGYTDDDIYFMSNVTFSSGVDVTTTLSNLEYAINTWATSSTQDVVLYMVGNGGFETFQMNANATEILSASDLDTWLDSLQGNIPGKVTVIYDACRSGSFLSKLTPPAEKERILISSTSGSQAAHFLSQGDISFSRFFWSRVLNGMNVRDAFVHAKNSLLYACQGQTPQMDDNGNGIGNEKPDGMLARYYTIGFGIMLAGDDPVIGSVCSGITLSGVSPALLWAEDVTTTGTIDRVWAVITPPNHFGNVPGQAVTDLPEVELIDNGSGHYEGTYSGVSNYGRHEVAIYVMDMDGNTSLPAETWIFRTDGPDIFEDDDMFDDANVIILNHEDAQRHNFHDNGDQDWVKFYGIAGESYETKTENLDTNCDTVITLYDESGTSEVATRDDWGYGENELLSWQCSSDGTYYVMVKQYYASDYGQDTGYDLRVYQPVGPLTGWIDGRVTDTVSGSPLSDVLITTSANRSAFSWPDSGYYMIIGHPAGGPFTLTAETGGYSSYTGAVSVEEGGILTKDITIVLTRGDINGDGILSQADVDIALQVLAGKSPAGIRPDYVTSGVDVNGDGKIGMEEVIYIKEKLEGIRE